MAQRLAYGHDSSVPEQQHGDGGVQHRPHPGGEDTARDVGSHELMREGERDGRIGDQVHGPPGLVPDPLAHGTRGGDADGDQECGAESGCSDRTVSEKVPGGGEEIGAGVGGVSAQSENHVCQAQREDMPSAATVPPREPVGADAVFDRGHARHEQQHDEHAVPGEQAGEMGSGREECVEPRRRPYLGAPERDDARGTAAERRLQTVWRQARGFRHADTRRNLFLRLLRRQIRRERRVARKPGIISRLDRHAARLEAQGEEKRLFRGISVILKVPLRIL